MSAKPLVALVIEDDPEHIETLRLLLEARHVEPIFARSHAEAMARIRKTDCVFDFVILDLGLPRHVGEPAESQLGWSLLDPLRLRAPRDDLYVLVLTATADRLKTYDTVLDKKGNAYVPRDDFVALEEKLAKAITEAGAWRARRTDERLVVQDWSDAKLLIVSKDEIHAVGAQKRRTVEDPGPELLNILVQLSYAADPKAGEEVGAWARSHAHRLSAWAKKLFRCAGKGRPFVSRGTRVVAKLTICPLQDPASRDAFEQRLRRTQHEDEDDD